MAKKRPEELAADERREQETVERNVSREESAPDPAYPAVNDPHVLSDADRARYTAGDPNAPGDRVDPRRYKDGTWTTGDVPAPAACGKPYTVARTETSPEAVKPCGLAAGHAGACGPAVAAEKSDVECFLEDAKRCQGVYALGNVVSADELKSLVGRAIGLIEARDAK